MSLSPEQKKAVASWVANGDNLSEVQKKLSELFQLSLTYRDVRFLVDDLNLELKDAAPKLDASDVTRVQPPPAAAREPATRNGTPEKKGFIEKAKEKLGLTGDADRKDGKPDDEEMPQELEDEASAGFSPVHVTMDNVTLQPGALASGTVAFSDGVSANWIVDQYGRPGFTNVSKPGYRPTPADEQAFIRELSAALQKRGL
jgi:hypothetical protein